MGLVQVFITCLVVFQFRHCTQATDCTKMPDNFKPWECCKFPPFNAKEIEKMKKIVEELNPDKIKDFTTECKTTEGLFKELKFVKEGDLDEAELLKYVDKVIEDNEWKPVFQAIIKDCHKKVNAKLSTVQTKMEAAPFNVKKDQCNVKYGSLLTCTKIDSFDNCPKNKWTEKEECTAAKKWVSECGKNFDSIMELYSKKNN